MQRQCGSQAGDRYQKREGIGESPLSMPASHFQATRDDRGGCSRYRVTKISFTDELGWYRENFAPMVWARFIFLKLIWR